jgi:hypothetical protein
MVWRFAGRSSRRFDVPISVAPAADEGRSISPYRRNGFAGKCCTIVPYFKIHAGKLPEVRLFEQLVDKSKTEPDCLSRQRCDPILADSDTASGNDSRPGVAV